MQTPEAKTQPRIVVRQSDPLQHFRRDGPWFRLAALLLCKLPLILMSLGGLLLYAFRFLG